MKQIKILLTLLVVIILTSSYVHAQLGGMPREASRSTASPNEMISMAPNMPFNLAVDLLSTLAKQRLGKGIIDPTDTKSEIGVKIDNLFWMDALDKILLQKGFIAVESKEYILIKSLKEGQPAQSTVVEESDQIERNLLETREVVISTLFFEANQSAMNELGSSWGLAVGNGMNYNTTPADGRASMFDISGSQKTNFGQLSVKIKALASRQMGEIIASPQVTVQSGKEGQIQIGSDFSVTVKDYAGNALTQFFSTGSIIKVKPHIFTVDSTTFLQVELEVTKSSANDSPLGIEVKKTDAKTTILLLDGEETVIGGLYSTEIGSTREGVPILKDLPWWVLGLRYIFGYETRVNIRKELIVLLKADLVPTLHERVQTRLSASSPDQGTMERGLDDMTKRVQDAQKQSDSREDPIK